MRKRYFVKICELFVGSVFRWWCRCSVEFSCDRVVMCIIDCGVRVGKFFFVVRVWVVRW